MKTFNIEEQWQLYLERVQLSENIMNPLQVQETKRAFMAGIGQLYMWLINDSAALTADEAEQSLHDLLLQLQEYWDEEAGLHDPVFDHQKCRVCGCTEEDCSICVAVTGKPCYWVEIDLCSACSVPNGELAKVKCTFIDASQNTQVITFDTLLPLDTTDEKVLEICNRLLYIKQWYEYSIQNVKFSFL
ncbi:hypothetical protein [Flavobacterium rhizosphaerae]|uniref:Uncharacterized protein n=1 Tax=Flavobacterium rhizosphaerae TaxID=3163298 RepID=A0ABW8YWQ6_9FLAO